jgi:hypothetical protein
MGDFRQFLVIRSDDFSFQITSPVSPLFYVRVVEGLEIDSKIIFSDFRVVSFDTDMALGALELTQERFGVFCSKKSVTVLDILPSMPITQSKDTAHQELCERHDQIVDLVRRFGAQHNFNIANAYLDFKNEKFNTIMEIG